MSVRVITGDCRSILPTLPADSVHCCVTSPPYWGLRDYGVAGQLGLEPTFTEFIDKMVEVFREVRRVLRPDGTLWLNLGDAYAHGKPGGGSVFDNGRTDGRKSYEGDKARGREKVSTLVDGLKPKDLCGIPWRVALALQADGWWLRQDIIWSKPNPMPESVTDRCTKAHEYLFLLTKSARYFYDAEAVKERASDNSHGGNPIEGGPKQSALGQQIGGRLGIRSDRNKRSVWDIATSPFPQAHFATFPPSLVEPCIKAGCPNGGTVLDPFGGAGTTGLVADRLQRHAILIELNPNYAEMARKRIFSDAPLFAEAAE